MALDVLVDSIEILEGDALIPQHRQRPELQFTGIKLEPSRPRIIRSDVKRQRC